MAVWDQVHNVLQNDNYICPQAAPVAPAVAPEVGPRMWQCSLCGRVGPEQYWHATAGKCCGPPGVDTLVDAGRSSLQGKCDFELAPGTCC